jgi:acetyl-CoA carboxylase carboxyl transferase subunit alpha
VEEIIPEPLGGAHKNPLEASQNLKEAILRHLKPFKDMTGAEIREQRYQRFRVTGRFIEEST